MNSDDRLNKLVGDRSGRVPSAEAAALAEAAARRHDGLPPCSSTALACGAVGWMTGSPISTCWSTNTAGLRFPFPGAPESPLAPNVFYLEVLYAGKTLRAKYAVLTLEDFDKGAYRWFHSYLWGVSPSLPG